MGEGVIDKKLHVLTRGPMAQPHIASSQKVTDAQSIKAEPGKPRRWGFCTQSTCEFRDGWLQDSNSQPFGVLSYKLCSRATILLWVSLACPQLCVCVMFIYQPMKNAKGRTTFGGLNLSKAPSSSTVKVKNPKLLRKEVATINLLRQRQRLGAVDVAW